MRKIILMTVIALSVLALAACGTGAEDPQAPDVVATVNGEPITLAEYQGTLQQQVSMFQQFGMEFEGEEGAAMLAELENYVMEDLINQKLLLTHARSEGFSADDAQVDQQMDEIRAQFADEDFDDVLEEYNLTEEILRNDIRNQLVTQAFMASLDTGFSPSPVTDEELEQAYAFYEEGTEDPQSFEDMRPQLEAELLEQQEEMHNQEYMADLLEELRQDADIQYTE